MRDQAKKRIFATPNIPVVSKLFGGIKPGDLSIRSLCLEESAHGLINLGLVLCCRLIKITKGCGGEPFAPVLALPAIVVALDVGRDEPADVLGHDPPLH